METESSIAFETTLVHHRPIPFLARTREMDNAAGSHFAHQKDRPPIIAALDHVMGIARQAESRRIGHDLEPRTQLSCATNFTAERPSTKLFSDPYFPWQFSAPILLSDPITPQAAGGVSAQVGELSSHKDKGKLVDVSQAT